MSNSTASYTVRRELSADYHQSEITIGPLGVLPSQQNSGVGRTLLRKELDAAKQLEIDAAILCGDPAYYGQLGFESAESYGVYNSANMYVDALQIAVLSDKTDIPSGQYHESRDYVVDEASATEFDLSFPTEQKLYNTKSQLEFQRISSRVRPRSM